MAVPALLMAACLMAGAGEAKDKKKGDDTGVQEITIKGKGPGGPPVRLPAVGPDAAVADEVAQSLQILRVEHKPPSPELRVPGGPAKRLSRPFPEPPFLTFNPKIYSQPYERWVFEVFEGERAMSRRSGHGRASEIIDWDGTDDAGRIAARVGQAYHFRFTGVQGGEELSLTSEVVGLNSLLYRESLGDVHMEVGVPMLFATGKAALLESAAPYLRALSDRLRRLNPALGPLRLTLFQREPRGRLAMRRAKAVKAFLLKSLIVHASRLEIDLSEPSDRGEILAAVLPPDGGAVIRND